MYMDKYCAYCSSCVLRSLCSTFLLFCVCVLYLLFGVSLTAVDSSIKWPLRLCVECDVRDGLLMSVNRTDQKCNKIVSYQLTTQLWVFLQLTNLWACSWLVDTIDELAVYWLLCVFVVVIDWLYITLLVCLSVCLLVCVSSIKCTLLPCLTLCFTPLISVLGHFGAHQLHAWCAMMIAAHSRQLELSSLGL